MLGIAALDVALAYWATILCSIFCVIWGLSRWNAPEKPEAKERHTVYPTAKARQEKLP